MSDYNRGAYTPPSNDAPLAFDARRPVRGGSPAPVTLIVSGVVLLVLIIGAWFIYKDGFRGADEAPKAVGSVVATPKTQPKEDDQPKNQTGGLVIYNQEDGNLPPADPSYAPAPETPLPRPAPPVVAKAPTTPVAEPAKLRPALPAPPPAKVAVAPASPAPAPAPAIVAPPPAKPGKGSFLVQVGAFSSPALADKGWSDAAAISPGSAAGKGKKVESVESGGKTLYRTSVTGFTDRASAQDFCDRLKAAGKACFVR